MELRFLMTLQLLSRYFPPFEWIVYPPGLLSISPYAWPFSSFMEGKRKGRTTAFKTEDEPGLSRDYGGRGFTSNMMEMAPVAGELGGKRRSAMDSSTSLLCWR